MLRYGSLTYHTIIPQITDAVYVWDTVCRQTYRQMSRTYLAHLRRQPRPFDRSRIRSAILGCGCNCTISDFFGEAIESGCCPCLSMGNAPLSYLRYAIWTDPNLLEEAVDQRHLSPDCELKWYIPSAHESSRSTTLMFIRTSSSHVESSNRPSITSYSYTIAQSMLVNWSDSSLSESSGRYGVKGENCFDDFVFRSN